MIFVDTGAWYASIVPADVNHAAATSWLQHNSQPLLTTDYVADETLTLLRMRGYPSLAIDLGQALFGGELANVLHVTERDVQEAWRIFRDYRDKDWSFTDCTCHAVMNRLKIEQAFSFDQHFRQFGSVQIVP